MTLLTRDSKKKLSKILHACTQRIPGLCLIFLVILLFVGPPFVPTFYWAVVLVFHVFLVTNVVRLAIGLLITTWKTKKYVNEDWSDRYQQFVAKQKADTLDTKYPIKPDDILHVIIIPNYKEEFETLCETLETLANHEQANRIYKVILAMEASEKDSEEKAQKLINIYGTRFFSLKYTVHPAGIPGEARGKSSNVSWSAKYYAENWLVASESQKELVTVMDADTQLSTNYFKCMSYKYCTTSSEGQSKCLYAPVLIFDRNANKVPFVVRLADFCWTIGLMSNFQLAIKFPCAVYTMSLRLAQDVGFWDTGPESIGEDIHMALKCWTHHRMKLNMDPIYIPASCSNVQADTYWGTIAARYQQAKRHLWVSLDFGYLSARLITKKCWPVSPFKSLLSLYLLFEIFYQPYFGFYHLTGQLIYPSYMTGFGSLVLVYTTYIRLSMIPFALIMALAYEKYHSICCYYRLNILKSIAAAKLQTQVNVEEALEGVEEAEAVPGLVVADVASGQEVAFRKWYQIFDWVGVVFSLFAYYLIPGVNAMLGQLFTNKLDYKVSLKPTAAVPKPAITDETSTVNPSILATAEDTTVDITDAHRSETPLNVDEKDSAEKKNDATVDDVAITMLPLAELKHSLTRGHVPTDSGVVIADVLDEIRVNQTRN